MTDNTKFLGFNKAQIPILSLLLAGFIMLAGMFYQLNASQNANYAALRADNIALRADNNALRAEMNALRSDVIASDNAHRAEINDLDSRIDILSVEAAETNARIVNIESRLPEYASVDERLDGLEREQARLAELVKALTNAE